MTTTPGSGAPSSGSRGSYNHGMNETSLSGSDEENKSERASSTGYSATEYPMVCCYDFVMMPRKSCDHELTVCSYQHINFHLLILHSSSLCLSLPVHVEFILFSSLHHYRHDSWNVDGQSYIFSSCFCLSPLLCPDPVSSSSSLSLPAYSKSLHKRWPE